MKTNTLDVENLEENFDEDSFEEHEIMNKEIADEHRNLEATTIFYETVPLYYSHQGETKAQYFNPLHDSAYRRGLQQGEYHVHYSFPKGQQFPVASFWLHFKSQDGEKRFKYVHLDLSKFVDNILRYYSEMGYEAPPERK